jgi:hypothetical protein
MLTKIVTSASDFEALNAIIVANDATQMKASVMAKILNIVSFVLSVPRDIFVPSFITFSISPPILCYRLQKRRI